MTNQQLSIEGMREAVLAGQRTLDTFRDDVNKYLAQQHQIEELPATQDCGIVRINLKVHSLVRLSSASWLRALHTLCFRS